MMTDIRKEGIIAHLPPHWRPYAVLARIDRPIGIWLLLLPGLWGITLASAAAGFSLRAIWIALLFVLGAAVMRAAGCIVNDLWDRNLDARVRRTQARPLASGEISPGRALVFLGALLFAGLGILLMLNGTTILLGLLAVPLIIIYPLMKRVTFWPQAFLGLTFNFSALMGWSAISENLGWPALFLYLAGFFWTMGYDTIYAHQDKEDDALIGIKSTALKFGRHARLWVAGFYAASVIFITLALLAASVSPYSGIGLLLVAAHFVWQVVRWDMNDPQSALETFRANRDAGLLVLAALAFGGIV